jgi:hypothetical protein
MSDDPNPTAAELLEIKAKSDKRLVVSVKVAMEMSALGHSKFCELIGSGKSSPSRTARGGLFSLRPCTSD